MTVDDEKKLFKYSFTPVVKYKASPKDTKKKAPAIPPGRSRTRIAFGILDDPSVLATRTGDTAIYPVYLTWRYI